MSENPFEGLPMFGELGKLFAQADPWEGARHLACSIATGQTAEANVDPVARQQFAELSRIAELHVGQATGLPMTRDGRSVTVTPVTSAEFATATLTTYRPLLQALGEHLHVAPPVDADAGVDPLTQLLQNMLQAFRPSLLAMSAGSMVGNLTKRSLGAYELPIPRPDLLEVPVIAPNLDAFATEWSLPVDDLRMWLCLHELTFHAVLRVPHVATAMTDLLTEYVRAFEPAGGDRLQELMSGAEAGGDLESMQAQLQDMLGSPDLLLGALRSPAHDELRPRIDALVSVLLGYVDHVVDVASAKVLGSAGALAEALRRRRLEMASEDRFVERLLGLELGRENVERGHSFVAGVLDRGGDLQQLWATAASLPTPNEVQAPGLWLARLEFG